MILCFLNLTLCVLYVELVFEPDIYVIWTLIVFLKYCLCVTEKESIHRHAKVHVREQDRVGEKEERIQFLIEKEFFFPIYVIFILLKSFIIKMNSVVVHIIKFWDNRESERKS